MGVVVTVLGVNRLLIVDDDEVFRSVLARGMRSRGFEAKSVGSSCEALMACEAFDPEFILLDLNLKGESGLNLIAPMRHVVPDARIVVLTGYASIQTTVTAMKLGASNYLPKPADIGDIVKALASSEPEQTTQLEESHLTVSQLELEYIQRKLAENQGNISATARVLKMHRRTLQRKLAKKRPCDLHA